jgi:hypothetical protein
MERIGAGRHLSMSPHRPQAYGHNACRSLRHPLRLLFSRASHLRSLLLCPAKRAHVGVRTLLLVFVRERTERQHCGQGVEQFRLRFRHGFHPQREDVALALVIVEFSDPTECFHVALGYD